MPRQNTTNEQYLFSHDNMMPFHGFHFIYGEYVNLNNASFRVLPPLRAVEKVINIELCVYVCESVYEATAKTKTTTLDQTQCGKPETVICQTLFG